MHTWKNEHAETCPVTNGRRSLLKEIARTPDDPYLAGAVPEWDEGGDEEDLHCNCGAKP